MQCNVMVWCMVYGVWCMVCMYVHHIHLYYITILQYFDLRRRWWGSSRSTVNCNRWSWSTYLWSGSLLFSVDFRCFNQFCVLKILQHHWNGVILRGLQNSSCLWRSGHFRGIGLHSDLDPSDLWLRCFVSLSSLRSLRSARSVTGPSKMDVDGPETQFFLSERFYLTFRMIRISNGPLWIFVGETMPSAFQNLGEPCGLKSLQSTSVETAWRSVREILDDLGIPKKMWKSSRDRLDWQGDQCCRGIKTTKSSLLSERDKKLNEPSTCQSRAAEYKSHTPSMTVQTFSNMHIVDMEMPGSAK